MGHCSCSVDKRGSRVKAKKLNLNVIPAAVSLVSSEIRSSLTLMARSATN